MTKNNTIESGTYYIRPAARHILTIGRDLIKDSYAALVELVKNSYDADATNVTITFSTFGRNDSSKKGKHLKIKVEDNGHGMNFKTVTTKWLVPSTDDKLKRKYSPNNRLMQGRKGIGRYAAAVLGNEMLMETVKGRKKTSMLVDWDEFIKNDYLDDVKLLVESAKIKEPSGTSIEITGDEEKIYEWSKPAIELLIKELRKLLSPFHDMKRDRFNVKLRFEDFPVEKYSNTTINVEPFPIMELYDYRLTGNIIQQTIEEVEKKYPIDKSQLIHIKKDKSFDESIIIADLKYENSLIKGIRPERIVEIINIDKDLYFGTVEFDFRIFDRDPEAIDHLIERGLKSRELDSYLGKREAIHLLDEICGVGIYRGGFRIRPHGDPGYDWLELDKQRVQDPSLKIGSNQIAGFITIQQEEISNLEEKSARDGLKENKYYKAFNKCIGECLTIVENKRFAFRAKTGRGRKHVKVEKELQRIFDLEKLGNKIRRRLIKLKTPQKEIEKINELIEKEGLQKTKLAERLRETVALYQGQVTLGKIIMVLMHEGNKPLAFFKNQIPLMEEHIEYLQKRYDKDYLTLVLDNLEGIKEQESLLVHLFEKLDPLAVRKRGKKQKFYIHKVIDNVRKVFENELSKKLINLDIKCCDSFTLKGWRHDFYVVLTNLLENSIYWLSSKKSVKNKVEINVFSDNGELVIDYKDNGPGIRREYIKDQLIFEPGFSTKPQGTGLGLAIAGEALQRNNGKIKAIYSGKGAYFRIEIEKSEGK